jgi:N-acyl amino acid synthase of PEP-CTERM/exosortase system
MTARFQARSLDDAPELLVQSYRLRYQVYCLERRFLLADDYPDRLERDAFDQHSVHVGVVDPCNELAGTARLVRNSDQGLPLFRRCTVFPWVVRADDPAVTLVEVSRLSISRQYSRRREDGCLESSMIPESDRRLPPPLHERRSGRDEVFITLLKAIYQAAKRLRATHWVAATETSLQRRVVQYGVPFVLAGPESEYLGRIAPYVMSLAEFDAVILGGQIAALDDFFVGLEPEFRPASGESARTAAPAGADRTLLATGGVDR